MPLDTNRFKMRLKPFDPENIPLDIGGANEVGIWDAVENKFLTEAEAKAHNRPLPERVARALCAATGDDPDATSKTFSGETKPNWQFRIKEARAAIDAVREVATLIEKPHQ